MTNHLTTRQPDTAARPRMGIRASARLDRRSRIALWEGFRYAVGVGGAVVPTGVLLKEGET